MSRVARAARRRIKVAVESLIFRGGPARIGREVLRGRAVVLAYHNIVPTGAPVTGDRSLHLPLRDFERQLDLLMETHEFVPLKSVLPEGGAERPVSSPLSNGSGRPMKGPGGERPRVAITFDDSYRGAVTAGVAALVDRGLPATIFVAPRFLDGDMFWWDAAPEEAMADFFRNHALLEMAGRNDAIRHWMGERNWSQNAVPDHQKGASLEELVAAARLPGISVASHSWSHPNLTRIPLSELEEELVRPIEWLREHFPEAPPVISYPYGLSTPTVEEAARRAGYQAAFRISGGWIPSPPGNLFALPRVNVSSRLSIEGFGARSAGLLCR